VGCFGLGVYGIPGYDFNDLSPLILDELLALLSREADLALLDYYLGDGKDLCGPEGLL
jgi:hypothetical protein